MNHEICGFEHLHQHTDHSLLDGLATCSELAERATKINQKFLCVTDHGMMAAIPRQIKECEERNLHPIIGCEIYLNPAQIELKYGENFADHIESWSDEDKKLARKSYHLLAIAYNAIGYKNLVRLSSWAWIHGFYRKPRVNHEMLLRHKEGIIFTSCCYNSEIGQAFDRGGDEAGFEMIEKYMAMFGKNFYLELMMLDFKKQKPYDAFIIRAHNKYHIPVILTQDVHYCNPEDSDLQRKMLMIQTKKTLKEIQEAQNENEMAEMFELQDKNLWMKSEDELNQKWESDYKDIIDYELFKKAKANTVEICNLAKGIEIDRSVKLPEIENSNERLKEGIYQGFKKRGLPLDKNYALRAKEEYELICSKGFSSYFLIQKMMVDEARRWYMEKFGNTGADPVGPGRGCLGAETPIVMSNGDIRFIVDVNVGDYVIALDGTSRKVLRKLEYNVKSENLLKICCYYGDYQGVILTKDHKVYAEKMRRPPNWDRLATSTKSFLDPVGNIQWFRADEIEVGDWVYVPKIITETSINDIFDLDVLSNGSSLICDGDEAIHQIINGLTKNVNRTKHSKRFIDLDCDFFKIMGLFAGDGWFEVNNSSYVGFAFNSHEQENIDFLTAKMRSYGFDDIRIRQSKTRDLVQVIIKNKFLRTLFEYLFDEYRSTPDTKHVPKMVINAAAKNVEAFLRGCMESDGSYGESKFTYTTVSYRLATQIRFLCLRLGIPSSLSVDKRIRPNGKCGYSVRIPKNCKIGPTDAQKRYVYRDMNEGLLLKIKSISEIKGITKVYDLEVEGQHNYLTSSFVVHNSAVGSLVCYCLGITGVDPIKHDLLFSRFLNPARGGKQMKTRFTIDPISTTIPISEQIEECPF